MHRIDTKTAQKDKFGAGKNGFTRGNPQTGTPATDLDDDYFDMLQEELCSVVEASGASLEKGRHDQLLTALRALLLSRKNPFGDIKSDGTVKKALENLDLGESTFGAQNCVVFDKAGVSTWNVPDIVKKGRRVRVKVIGGGGSGGYPAINTTNPSGGGGGGGGGVSESVIDLTGISTVTITVGSGGTGQNTSASNGRQGGTSSFGTYLSATGGDG
ncbi:glycine-rich domain-containing protein, partial [Escherichia coli]|uniref:glycine-rich domain-containing protein n=1 Tax=Escherichia coli TaxID=562 RepID=UPI00201AE52D